MLWWRLIAQHSRKLASLMMRASRITISSHLLIWPSKTIKIFLLKQLTDPACHQSQPQPSKILSYPSSALSLKCKESNSYRTLSHWHQSKTHRSICSLTCKCQTSSNFSPQWWVERSMASITLIYNSKISWSHRLGGISHHEKLSKTREPKSSLGLSLTRRKRTLMEQ